MWLWSFLAIKVGNEENVLRDPRLCEPWDYDGRELWKLSGYMGIRDIMLRAMFWKSAVSEWYETCAEFLN